MTKKKGGGKENPFQKKERKKKGRCAQCRPHAPAEIHLAAPEEKAKKGKRGKSKRGESKKKKMVDV